MLVMLYRLGVIDWFWSYLNCTWRISISISLYWWCSPGGQALLLAPLLLAEAGYKTKRDARETGT
jgi:hypothetical protein|uniref:Uncharacterized protein n=1 Tax=Picea glauca TaxID=3330 RepID=A0A101LVC9_PICGL|nr:hypothetical protein ABT39_MTgene2157 [Picea glauca]QHR87212.1 hypothetical protein Q903MT_gene1221 [Picea sitchensis]